MLVVELAKRSSIEVRCNGKNPCCRDRVEGLRNLSDINVLVCLICRCADCGTCLRGCGWCRGVRRPFYWFWLCEYVNMLIRSEQCGMLLRKYEYNGARGWWRAYVTLLCMCGYVTYPRLIAMTFFQISEAFWVAYLLQYYAESTFHIGVMVGRSDHASHTSF